MKKFKLSEGASNSLAPSSNMIDKFFTKQLHYSKGVPEYKNNQLIIIYKKNLSQADNPAFPELAGINCLSTIVVNLMSGKIKDHYFRVNRGVPVRGTQDSQFERGSPLDLLLYYHSNIVHASREYIAGGWLYRKKINAQLQENRSKFKYITEETCAKNILEIAKPGGLKNKEN